MEMSLDRRRNHAELRLFLSFQEISFDVFLQVIWEDKRIQYKNESYAFEYVELKLDERHKLWVWRYYIFYVDYLYVIGTEIDEFDAENNLN